jgi:hypothetical protein
MRLVLYGLVGLLCGSANWSPAMAGQNDRPHFKVLGTVIVWGADNGGTAPTVTDFVVDDSVGAGDSDLIAEDGFTVVTGTLLPSIDSSSLSAVASRVFNVQNSSNGNGDIDSNGNGETDAGDTFELGNNTRLGLRDSVSRTSFYVASNVAFNIDGQAVRVVGRNDNVMQKIYWDMSVTQSGTSEFDFGAQSQLPHSTGPAGGVDTFSSLFEMMTPRTVFAGDQRTAAAAGSIADQSVRFDVVYTLGHWQGYSLSTNHTNLAEGVYEVEAEVVYTVWVP